MGQVQSKQKVQSKHKAQSKYKARGDNGGPGMHEAQSYGDGKGNSWRRPSGPVLRIYLTDPNGEAHLTPNPLTPNPNDEVESLSRAACEPHLASYDNRSRPHLLTASGRKGQSLKGSIVKRVNRPTQIIRIRAIGFSHSDVSLFFVPVFVSGPRLSAHAMCNPSLHADASTSAGQAFRAFAEGLLETGSAGRPSAG